MTPPEARIRALDAVLRPRSIAVVGASRRPNTIGSEIVANLVRHGYTGPVYPINPKATSILSVPAWPSLAALPAPPDLAVVVVPKEHVLPVAEEAIAAGVRGLVVISAGFKEVGPAGAERERALTDLVRRHGVRMIGPNCMGVLNADPEFAMNATFAPAMPPFGRAAFVSQSGAMGLSVLDYAREYGIGISQFVSVGNKSDVSGNDLLAYWEDDPTVEVVLMYVENFGNPRKFLELATRLTRRKPIIVVKSGRSQAGARAASSHTGALAASDAAVEALLVQSGVIRAGSVEELFDYGMAFSGQAPPRGRRVAVLTNSGGPGILAADALDRTGLAVTDLSPPTVTRLQPLFPAEASIRNPLDMIASARPEGYRAALDAILDDPAVDAVMAIFVPPLGVRQEDVAEAIASVVAAHPDKPVVGVLMGKAGLPQGRAELHEVRVPAYIFPESAARALAALVRWREWSEREPSAVPDLAVDVARARGLVAAARVAGRTRLDEAAALALLACYGIPVAEGALAPDADAAVAAADRLGYPVAVKAAAAGVSHKSDIGGVRLGLADAGAVREAAVAVLGALAAAGHAGEADGVLVQRMAAPGREVIVGLTREPGFGPMVMFGLGGIFVEVLRDVTFRLCPVTPFDAGEMLDGIRGRRVLDGVRGQPAVDRSALVDILVRVARLGLDLPEVAALDLNPVLARPDGATAADARVILAPPAS